MQSDAKPPVESAELLLGTEHLDEDLAFFRSLGFALDLIFPADAPEVAVLSGHGFRLRLDTGVLPAALTLRLTVCKGEHVPAACEAPGGTRIEWFAEGEATDLSTLKSTLVVCRNSDVSAWGTGRAGMQYRDLIPDRVGGHFIASHIRIPDGGPVPDYVHYHHVNVQIIYCLKGWVKVVYEDQGEPFVLEAGDCVLQPPAIRHRVLECSSGMEVLEIGSPARHETRTDREMALPNGRVQPDREFGGQVFLRHRVSQATFAPWHFAGFTGRDTGLETATRGLARLWVAQRVDGTLGGAHEQLDAFRFWFVREGSIRLSVDGEVHELGSGDSISLPRGARIELLDCSADAELIDFAQA